VFDCLFRENLKRFVTGKKREVGGGGDLRMKKGPLKNDLVRGGRGNLMKRGKGGLTNRTKKFSPSIMLNSR